MIIALCVPLPRLRCALVGGLEPLMNHPRAPRQPIGTESGPSEYSQRRRFLLFCSTVGSKMSAKLVTHIPYLLILDEIAPLPSPPPPTIHLLSRLRSAQRRRPTTRPKPARERRGVVHASAGVSARSQCAAAWWRTPRRPGPRRARPHLLSVCSM
jgi:hypothetical protein